MTPHTIFWIVAAFIGAIMVALWTMTFLFYAITRGGPEAEPNRRMFLSMIWKTLLDVVILLSWYQML